MRDLRKHMCNLQRSNISNHTYQAKNNYRKSESFEWLIAVIAMASESQISSDSQTESDELRSVHGFHLRISQIRACCNFENFDAKGCVPLYRCLRISCASIIMVLSSWGAFLLGTWCQFDSDVGSFDCEIAAATRHLDMSFWGMMASTTVAGCGAMWLWCHAATPHLIQASSFLILNWIEGLVTLSLILSTRTHHDYFWGSWASILLSIRLFLLVCELVSLQALIQNRLQSIWPALQRPRLGVWLRRLLWTELALLILSSLLIVVLSSIPLTSYSASVSQIALVAALAVIPSCFVVWVLLVFMALCRVFSIFRATLKMVQDASPESSKILQRSRRAASLQGVGLVISLATTSSATTCLFFSIGDWSGNPDLPFFRVKSAQCLNLVVNTVGVIAFSGAYRLWSLRASSAENFAKTSGFTKCCAWPTRPDRRLVRNLGGGSEWEAKVRELAGRGISLRELLHFYRRLGSEIMLSYQSDVHTTNDVVRLAIIPLTAASCSSYAELVNGNESLMPKKMVTHNWSNLFRDLLASVVADAIGEHTFELVSALLSDEAGVNALEQIIELQGNSEVVYWICAFSVNQHAGICGANPCGDVDPVTMLPHPVCSCRRPKFFNETPPLNDSGESILCEMNKFDDMMSFLASTDPSFSEVVASPSMVAVDASLDLFSRAWCMAELAEAQRMGMGQCLLIRNKATLLSRQHSLENLRVQDMTATRREDVDAILAKIPDKEAFNSKLQELIFDQKMGLLTAWKQADALQQMEDLSHILKWARMSTIVKDGLQVWQKWTA